MKTVACDVETKCSKKGCQKPKCEHALIPHLSSITQIGVYSDEASLVFVDVAAFREWLEQNQEVRLIGHNFKFDLIHLYDKAVDLRERWVGNSQLLATVVPEKIPDEWLKKYEEKRKEENKRLGKAVHREAGKYSLKTLAPYFLNVPPFWEELGHESNEYVLKDCRYTYELYQTLFHRCPPSLLPFYEKKLLPWAKMIVKAELRGVAIDLGTMAKMKEQSQQEALVTRHRLGVLWKEAFDGYKNEQASQIYAQFQEKIQSGKVKDVIKGWAKTQEKVEKIKPFNLDSPSQLMWLLRDHLNLDVKNLSAKESTGKEVLERLAASQEREDIRELLKYRKANKLITSFFPTYEELAKRSDEGVSLHPSYRPAGTRTMRLSCIEENQLVLVPGGEKPIKDIKVGDYVYCYKDTSPTLRKVLRVIDNGEQECVELKWQGTWDKQIGTLICTPDHLILTKRRGWVRADQLKRYERLVHMRRRKQVSGRVRVYGRDHFMEREESLIKREYFHAPSHMHIHHKNHNKGDNSLENLEVMTASEHLSLHHKHSLSEGKIKWKHLLQYRPKPRHGENHPSLCYNHMVQKVTPVGTRRVFDLEVEGEHNFIASEICVHNCSSPNLQQVSSSIRPLFRARPGYQLITYDMSAIEPRVIAFYSECPKLFSILENAEDFHGHTTRTLFGFGDVPVSEIKTLYPKERKLGKEVGLALFYGAGPNRIRQSAQKHGFQWDDAQCFEAFKRFKREYKAVFEFRQGLEEELKSQGYLPNLIGRPIDVPMNKLRMTALNTLIQSSASDMVLNAAWRIQSTCEDNEIDAHVILLVHDEIVVESIASQAERVEEIIKQSMTSYPLPTRHGPVKLLVEGTISDQWEKS